MPALPETLQQLAEVLQKVFIQKLKDFGFKA
jgi:hypothetical protein